MRSARTDGVVAVRGRRDHHELLAAVSGDDVARPDGTDHRAGDALEHGIADGMAVLVVDLGEPVEVEHDQAQLGAGPLRGGIGRLDGLVEEASVEEAGELVADGGLAHPRVQFGVMQGELGLGHQQVGDPQLELAERPIGTVARRR